MPPMVDGCTRLGLLLARHAADRPAGHGHGRAVRRDLRLERVPGRPLRHRFARAMTISLGAATPGQRRASDRLEHRRRGRRRHRRSDPALLALRPALHRARPDRRSRALDGQRLLHRRRQGLPGRHAARCGLHLEVGDGEFMVFVGPSGCGKTTALRMVAGLEDITEGEIRIGDAVVNDVAPAASATSRWSSRTTRSTRT